MPASITACTLFQPVISRYRSRYLKTPKADMLIAFSYTLKSRMSWPRRVAFIERMIRYRRQGRRQHQPAQGYALLGFHYRVIISMGDYRSVQRFSA